MRTRIAITLIALLLAAQSTASELEVPWLSLGDRIAVLRIDRDPLRGFDEVHVETRRVRRGALKRMTSRPAIPEADRARWSASGDYDLYRRDLAAALAAERARRVEAGWRPVESRGLELFGVEISQRSVRRGASTQVSLVRGDHSCHVARERIRTIALSHERGARLALDRVADLAVTADGRWLLVSVDTNVPRHGQVLPERRIFVLPLERVRRALKIPLPDAEPETSS